MMMLTDAQWNSLIYNISDVLEGSGYILIWMGIITFLVKIFHEGW